MRQTLSVICACLLGTLSMGLEVPARSRVGDFVTVTHAPASFLKITPERTELQRVEVSETVTLFTGVAGTYQIQEVYQEAGKWIENNASVVIGDQGPEPPVPPGPVPPGPEPEPPGPGPTPNPPAPTPATDLAVLIVYETADPTPFPLSSIEVRGWLNTNCGTIDGVPMWRKWDDDYKPEDLEHEAPRMVALYKKANADRAGKLPWIVIEGPRGNASVPLPKTDAALLDLLKSKGG